MEVLQKYVLFFRKKYYKNKTLTILIMSLSIVILFVLGYFIDLKIIGDKPTRVTNFIRTIVVSINSLLIFPFMSILIEQYQRNKKEKDEEYVSLKNNLSHNQRMNLAIIVSVILIFLHILLFDTSSNLYSFISSLILSIILLLINFVNMTYYEKELEEEGLIDIRDMEHALNLEEKRKEKKRETDEKTEL